MEENSIKWVAFLSNGETIVEGKGIASLVTGEDSPWHKLQGYIKRNALVITGLSLWIGDRHYNLPSNNPKFQGEVPKGYNFFKRGAMDADILGGGAVGGMVRRYDLEYVCIEAIYDNYKVQIWVDGMDNNKSWVNVKPVKNG